MIRNLIVVALVAIFVSTATGQCTTCSETPAAGPIVPFSTLACSIGGLITVDSHYFRVYTPAECGVTTPVDVCAIDFGVESCASGDGVSGMVVVVRAYADTALDNYPGIQSSATPVGVPGTPNPASLTLLCEDYVYVPDSGATIYHHEWYNGPCLWDPIATPSELVIEVFVPTATSGAGALFMGADPGAETDFEYFQAAGCSIASPTAFFNPGLILDVTIAETVGSGGMGCDCLGPQMLHPGTSEDLIMTLANRTTGTDMTTGHGGETEKAAIAGDVIECRWGSPLGSFDLEPWFMLGTLLDVGVTTVPVAFPGITGHDIYADLASPLPFATTAYDGRTVPNIGPQLLSPGTDNTLHFIIPAAIGGTGLSFMLQTYATPPAGAGTANGFAAASNGHTLGPF